jgi:hypothetical protein
MANASGTSRFDGATGADAARHLGSRLAGALTAIND